ncbi:hypothetical protein [Catenuloplanes atrovinosus]|uniref:Uncharacterized protein n=1 Tax=Catenuloplanes atrovinosus TaxID=137266 RepID=A0AAE4CAK2_9ACTN|nr:hypothetical protein [Catenuloplanes atrovinosus]MDR7277676.1 hypothetical protein [Catenuloplanes atrovinosus]
MATPASPALAAGCRSAPFSASLYGADPFMALDHVIAKAYPSATSSYVSTSQCPRGISVKNIGAGDMSGAPFHVCVNFISGGGCKWTRANPGQWAYVATDVPRGTRFRIQILWNPGVYYSFKAVADF